MKRILICTVLLISGILLFAAGPEKEPYFCTRPGTKLYYERTKAGSTKLLQTTLFEIESYQDGKVYSAVTMAKANGKEMYGGRARQTALISPEGNTSLNFGETVKGFVQNIFPHSNIEATESYTILPAVLQPGDTLPEAHCTVTVGGIRAHFHLIQRRVLRRETITTPAGTFDCIVVREWKNEDVPLRHRENWQDNYYVPGLGYVRHDKFDKNMRLLESEVLVRIENSPSTASNSQP